jgi:hypothetical protein
LIREGLQGGHKLVALLGQIGGDTALAVGKTGKQQESAQVTQGVKVTGSTVAEIMGEAVGKSGSSGVRRWICITA